MSASAAVAQAVAPMADRMGFLIGGLGDLAPALPFLVTGDLVAHLTKLDTFLGLGYAARGIGLFLVGGLIAPALLAGAVTASQLAPPRAEHAPATAISIVATAHAQACPQ
jgi:hypothetical protein